MNGIEMIHNFEEFVRELEEIHVEDDLGQLDTNEVLYCLLEPLLKRLDEEMIWDNSGRFFQAFRGNPYLLMMAAKWFADTYIGKR